MSKYESKIFLDSKKQDAAAKTEAVEDAQNEVQNAIFAAKRAVRDEQKKLKNAESAVPFRPVTVIQYQLSVADVEANLEALEAMNKSMF